MLSFCSIGSFLQTKRLHEKNTEFFTRLHGYFIFKFGNFLVYRRFYRLGGSTQCNQSRFFIGTIRRGA